MSAMSDLHLTIRMDMEDADNTMTIDQLAEKHCVTRDDIKAILVDVIDELLGELTTE